jgi:transposase
VAALLGASHSSVKKWKTALAAKPPPPRTSKLTGVQKSQLVKILLRGPLACGYPTDLWTCRRVAEVVQKRFGVSYHPDHLGRILHDLGFTPQKPEQQARERDEAAIGCKHIAPIHPVVQGVKPESRLLLGLVA